MAALLAAKAYYRSGRPEGGEGAAAVGGRERSRRRSSATSRGSGWPGCCSTRRPTTRRSRLLAVDAPDSFAGEFADRRGDVLVAQGKRDEARAAYRARAREARRAQSASPAGSAQARRDRRGVVVIQPIRQSSARAREALCSVPGARREVVRARSRVRAAVVGGSRSAAAAASGRGRARASPRCPSRRRSAAPVAARLAWTHRIGAVAGRLHPGGRPAGSVYAASVARHRGAARRGHGRRSSGRSTSARALSSGVGATASIVVVAARDGSLIALDAQGQRKWAVPLGAEAVTRAGGRARPRDGARERQSRPGLRRPTPASGAGRFQRQNAAARAATDRVDRDRAGHRVRRPAGRSAGGAQPRDRRAALGGGGRASRAARPRSSASPTSSVRQLVSGREVCAVELPGQARLLRRTERARPLWSREVSSARGLDVDARCWSASPTTATVSTRSRAPGASVWRQDKLRAARSSRRRCRSEPVRAWSATDQGFVHLLSRDDGAIAGRFRHRRHARSSPRRWRADASRSSRRAADRWWESRSSSARTLPMTVDGTRRDQVSRDAR